MYHSTNQRGNRQMPYLMTIVRFLLTASLILAGGQLAANPVPKGIKGADNRVRVNGADAKWSALGRVHLAGRGFCTGVLVEPDKVLTAGHCVWNRHTGKPLPPQYLYFVAGYHKESFIAASAIKQITLAPDFQPGDSISLEAAEKDWALLELETPIEGISPIPMLSMTAKDLTQLRGQRQILQAGFGRDSPYVLSVDDQCGIQVKIMDLELVTHNCDAIRGGSGSPLMIQTSNGLRVVALHSSNRHPNSGDPLGLAIPVASISRQPQPVAMNAGGL